MAKVFITGSSDGIGKLAASKLIAQGHEVWVHARNAKRADDAKKANPKARGCLVADLSNLAEVKHLANDVNGLGPMDAIIHNAGVYQEPQKTTTKDGIANLFMINTLAPYMLTGLITKPKRLIYISSGLHLGAEDNDDYEFKKRTWNSMTAYSESKFHDVLIAFSVARKYPSILSNALEPGWVPTKMGGAGAPDDLDEGAETQVWLATSDDAKAKVTGQYFFHKKLRAVNELARDNDVQNKFLAYCEKASGVKL